MNFLNKVKNPLINRKKENRIKNSIDAFTITIWVIMVVWCLLFCLMLFWSFMTSLQTDEAIIFDPGGIPKEPQWKNYIKAFSQISMDRPIASGGGKIYFLELFYNSVMFAAVTPFLCVMSSCVTSYVVSKYSQKVKFVALFFSLTIFCTYMPISGSIGATLKWQKAFGIYDTFWAVWINETGAFGSMFLLYFATFKGVSNEYIEAAQIDGAGHWRIFLQVVWPMTTGTFWALYITTLVNLWNDYSTPLMYLPSHPTISLASWQMQSGSEYSFPVKLAGLMIVITPILIVFIIFRDKILNAQLTLAGLKG